MKYLVLISSIFVSSCQFVNKVSKVGIVNKPLSYVELAKKNSLEKADKSFANQNFAMAAFLYKPIFEKNNKDIETTFKYAESLRLSGNYEDSIPIYDLIIGENDYSLFAIEGKALAYLAYGKIKEVEYLFKQILNQDSTRWRTINALGVVSSLLGKNEDAMKYYDLAIKVSKNNPAVKNNVGLSTALSGDTEEGIKILEDTLSTLSHNNKLKEKVDHNLALVYGISGQMEKAQDILINYLSTAQVFNNLGLYAKLNDNKDLAKTYLSKSLSSSPVLYEKAFNNLKSID